MAGSPIEVIEEVRKSLREWLDGVQKSPDPASRQPGELQKLSADLKRVDVALGEVSPGVGASMEWKKELEAYTLTLREMRARLGNFEVTLRIRSQDVAAKQLQLGAVKSWADLAKHIG
jgi:hypothetical protein